MNTWPLGFRHAISQTEHKKWNLKNFSGTLQLCAKCSQPTGRCEDDSLYADDDGNVGPLCEDCYEFIIKQDNTK